MTLTGKQKRELRAQAHKLKPVVSIGNNGLTDPVLVEIDKALYDHELIKVKIYGGDKEYREQILQEICEKQDAHHVQSIGHILVLYRESDKEL
ncbi:MAG: ribosome assembly RNA-binding protein YhbY [Legionellales bacterium]|nr:ribosome assembly RNA-binding protein YhbY [Legionellales bacterium]|tara:strand:- start:8539 stop:8817 length:279 start_codon:yes stop_codon:yes gene_type:complete